MLYHRREEEHLYPTTSYLPASAAMPRKPTARPANGSTLCLHETNAASISAWSLTAMKGPLLRVKRKLNNLPPHLSDKYRGTKVINIELGWVGFIAYHDTTTKEVWILYPPKPRNPENNAWSAGSEQPSNLKRLR
jgi:hypothetical protein